jgi:hypothetical protein
MRPLVFEDGQEWESGIHLAGDRIDRSCDILARVTEDLLEREEREIGFLQAVSPGDAKSAPYRLLT